MPSCLPFLLGIHCWQMVPYLETQLEAIITASCLAYSTCGVARLTTLFARNSTSDGFVPCLQVRMVHMVRMLSLLMADQLRTAVLSSVAAYLSMWQQFVQQDPSQPAPLKQNAAAAGGVMVSLAAACTRSHWCLSSSSLACST